MRTILFLTAAVTLGASAVPASSSPLNPVVGPQASDMVEAAQFAERAERSMSRGLKTLQRNSDKRAPSGDGTVRHPRAPAENARTNHQAGGPRPANR